MKIIFVDIDGTLTRSSTERKFIRFLFSTHSISVWQFVWSIVQFFFIRFAVTSAQWKEFKRYLRNFQPETIDRLAEECFEKFIVNDFRRELLDELQRCRAKGDSIVLLSGSIRPLVNAVAKFLKADTAICSELECVKGRYTGKITGLHPYGVHKKTLAESFCYSHGSKLREAVAYANDYSDRHLLDSAGKAIAVFPDRKLKSLALKKTWEIIE